MSLLKGVYEANKAKVTASELRNRLSSVEKIRSHKMEIEGRRERRSQQISMAGSFGKWAGNDGTRKDRLPSLPAMGTLDFARSSFIGAGMGVQSDGVFLVAARAGEVDQNVESRRFRFRLCGLP